MLDVRNWKIRAWLGRWSPIVFAGCFVQLSTAAAAPPAGSAARPTVAQASRFLEHATWGPTWETVDNLQAVGYEQFLNEQFEAPASSYPSLPLYPTTAPAGCDPGTTCRRDNYSLYLLQNRFFTNALYGRDQLRQRVAFALHQIFVVSGVEVNLPSWIAPYLQVLDRNAFGNFRQLLYEITLNPAMGNYLDMVGNNRTAPNENYAREVLQLFSIGLVRLNDDGTPQLDTQGNTIPTYDQNIVNAFARLFTGWNFAAAPAQGTPNYIDLMVANQSRHDVGAKTLLRGINLPANQTAAKDLSDGLDNIFNDPNIGPFIGKQLIQHLVTSNPSPSYVRRVTAVFNDNGSGVRGDLRAVVRAILLDDEAVADSSPEVDRGHLKHPALYITNLLRAFNARSADGTTTSDGYLNPQSVNMGMDLFRPPSVFSYFSPFFTLQSSTQRAPEFGLLNTSTSLQRANFVNTMSFSRIAVSANAPSGTSLDFALWQSMAASPYELVANLNAFLTADQLSNDTVQTIIAAVNAVSATNTLARVETAVYLVASSAQYQVAR